MDARLKMQSLHAELLFNLRSLTGGFEARRTFSFEDMDGV